MVVKIVFGQRPVAPHRPGNDSRLATLAASVFTLVSISFASLAIWRIGTDLEWAGDFVIPSGFLSHWQVWMGAAIAVQYLGWRLGRYARKASAPQPEAKTAEESVAETSPVETSPVKVRAVANV
jgi:hypothetical protein